MKNREQIIVEFRKNEDYLFAFFPKKTWGSNVEDKMCYSTVGQHSSCSIEYAEKCELIKNPMEYQTLLAELKEIGYTYLDIVNERNTRKTYTDLLNAVMEGYEDMLGRYEEDITSGISDGLYDEVENQGNLAYIVKCKADMEALKAFNVENLANFPDATLIAALTQRNSPI